MANTHHHSLERSPAINGPSCHQAAVIAAKSVAATVVTTSAVMASRAPAKVRNRRNRVESLATGE